MGFAIEGFARDVFVELDVAIGDVLNDFGRHFRHLLAVFALETVVHQPFAHKFFRKLLLRFAFLETFGVTLGIEIATGVGSVDFVHEINLTVVLSELVLGVYEDQTALGGHLGAAFEESERVFLQNLVFFGRGQAAFEDLCLRDVGVMFTDFGFRGGRYDGSGELFVLAHTVGKRNAADFASTCLISAPSAAAKITAHDHLDGKTFAGDADSDHRIGRGLLPIRANVRRGVEKLRCNLIQHLAFERNTLGEHHVEG